MRWQLISQIFKVENKIQHNCGFSFETRATQHEYVNVIKLAQFFSCTNLLFAVCVSLTLKHVWENHLSSCSLFDTLKGNQSVGAIQEQKLFYAAQLSVHFCPPRGKLQLQHGKYFECFTSVFVFFFVFLPFFVKTFLCVWPDVFVELGTYHVTVATVAPVQYVACHPFSLDLSCCQMKAKWHTIFRNIYSAVKASAVAYPHSVPTTCSIWPPTEAVMGSVA